MKWKLVLRHHRPLLLHRQPLMQRQQLMLVSGAPFPSAGSVVLLSCQYHTKPWQLSLRWSSTSSLPIKETATDSVPPASHIVISFYKFLPIPNPEELKEAFARLMRQLDGRGRIYMNRIGINGQLCIPHSGWELLLAFLHREVSPQLDLKTQHSSGQVFNRVRVRHGKLLEGLDEKFDFNNVGKHLDAESWNRMLDASGEKSAPMVLDVRNRYEWEIGHFKGSQRPEFEKFREFSAYAAELAEKVDREKNIMMYCTGGIRCEWFSTLLKKKGFRNVFQLEGGVLKYSSQGNTRHWRGKLFVFDDRLVVPVKKSEEDEIISRCQHCGIACDTCYNCHNYACSQVFVACGACAAQFRCCCSPACAAGRVLEAPPRNSLQVDVRKTVGRGEHYRKLLVAARADA